MKAPVIHSVSSIPLQLPMVHPLSNEAVIYDLRLGTQEILKIEWLFDAGRWYEIKPLASRITAQLIKSGIKGMSADELADEFDFYGAKLKVSDDFDVISIRLYCLTKHFARLLPLVYEMILRPVFDAKELELFCSRNKQTLKLELQKNDVIAYRVFTELLFGEKHPYGYNSSPEMYDDIRREDLLEQHQRSYGSKGCKVIISGRTNDEIVSLLKKYTLELPHYKNDFRAEILDFPKQERTVIRQDAPKESNQASIRIGSRLFDKKHPDYSSFYFVNTLLGGYFGARLMQNLREDKGLTYSVYSSMETMRHGGYFYIFTDVNNHLKESALSEIYFEMDRLQTELVDHEELDMLKNYSLGMFLNAVDGVFNVSSVIRELIEEDLDFDFFETMVSKTRDITSEEVQSIAQTYFQKDQLSEVVVG
jgi:zinc protease